MASFKEDVQQGLRERIESNTGIVGGVLRERREQKEKQTQVDNEVAEIKKVTGKIKVGGTTLFSMERSFTQISENLQLIAKALKAQATTFEETQAAYKPQEKTVTAQPKQQEVIKNLADEKEEVSLFDRISNLIDNFEKKRKKQTRKEPVKKDTDRKAKEKAEADRKAKEKAEAERKEKEKKAEAERKELEKNKEKTRAQAEKAQQAAREEARAAGKSTKQVEQAGKTAAKKVVKKANANVVKKIARKFILAKIGKAVVKTVPIIGTAVGVAFLVDAIWNAIKTNNYTKVGAEAAGLVPIVGGAASAIGGAAADTYMELYGTDYLTDKANGVEGADAAWAECNKIVAEEFEKAVKEALKPRIEEARSKGIVQQNEELVAKFKAEKERQEAAKREQKAPPPTQAPTPSPVPAPPPAPSARQAPVKEIREVAKQKAEQVVSGTEPLQKKISPAAGKKAMLDQMDRQKITDPVKRAAIMAQSAVETGGFNYLSENLGYSLQGLKNNFKRLQNVSDDEIKEAISKGVTGIGSLIYGGDPSSPSYNFGIKNLGNIQPGDGFKFRGRGFFQLTGRANYQKAGAADAPQKLLELGPAAETAVNFANRFKGDYRDVSAFTKFVNGGQIHVKERGEYFEKFLNDPSITQMRAETSPSTGQNINEASTDVASAKKAQQAGSSVTVVAVNNNTQTKMGAANRPLPSQTTAVVGA